MLRHLCLCHSVIIDPKNGQYNSSSPDEIALIDGAKLLNSLFVSKDQENLLTISLNGHLSYFKLLATFDFSSARKRMSVLLEDLQAQETSPTRFQLLIKGADSVLMPRLLSQSSDIALYTQHIVDQYAREGLRTLLLA